MTTIKTGLKADKPAVFSTINGRLYATNDFDRVQAWDGVWASTRDAGMAAPATVLGAGTNAAGNVTLGVHLVRYRYTDSTSPGAAYRSNPSAAVSITVASTTKTLNFTVGAAATDIIRSTDSKCDTIQVEATLAAGSTYYVVGTLANAGVASFSYNVSDTTLAALDLTSLYDDFGHEQPPAGSIIAECRNYAFIGGGHARTITCGATNNSATVTSAAAFSTLWVGRMVRFGAETTQYLVTAVASTSSLTVTPVYAGTTNAAASGVFYAKNNRIYWSKAGFPESFKAVTRVRDVLNGRGDRLVGMSDFLGDLYLFGTRSIQRLVFQADPGTGELNTIAGEFGVWNQRCIYGLDGALFGWGANGAWMMTGGRPRWISKKIDTTVAALVNTALSDQFFAVYDPKEKIIRWHFVATGGSVPRHAMTYDIVGDRWIIDQWRQGIDAGVTVASGTGNLRLAVTDSTNGRAWYAEGASDGVPAASTGDYTVAAGSTTTVIQITGSSLPTGTGTDLAGTILYDVTSAQERLVASNTTSAITLSTALSAAPASGALVYVGAIPCVVESNWTIFDGMEEKTSPPCLWLKFIPQAAGTVRVEVYKDFSTTPIPWTKSVSDIAPKYLSWTNNATFATLSLTTTATNDGFVNIPLFSDWARSWKFKLTVLSPAGSLRLLDSEFKFQDKSNKGQETTE